MRLFHKNKGYLSAALRNLTLLFFITLSSSVNAQLCQGSLGDPLVNITFGSGGNPGAPLTGAATSYRYTAADCPTDGEYTVRHRSDRCYGGWNSLLTDHTGDPNGYFMLVNASFDPGDFYVDTVELACSNTTYEFAAWVTNMNTPAECGGNSIRPNLTFIIARTDGTVLQSFNTGDIPPQNSVNWQQFGFFFNMPSLVNRVVLKVRNNARGGCGNDLALDDITFRPCGPKLDVALSGGSREVTLCQGTAAQVQVAGTISPGFDNPFLQWQRSDDNGATWVNIAGANSTTLTQDFSASAPVANYRYRLTAARIENRTILACRVNSEPLTVRINSKPTITAAPVQPLCQGATLQLSVAGGATYSWTGNGLTATGETVTISNIQPDQAGRFYVTGTDTSGCQNRDSVDITVHPAPKAIVNRTVFSLCQGEAVQLEASGGNSYLWSPANGLSSVSIANPMASPADSVRYKVVVASVQGCTDSASVDVHVYKRPFAEAGPDKEIGQGQSVVLNGAASGTAVQYTWTPVQAIDDPGRLQPRVMPIDDQIYRLTVTSTVGCGQWTDSVKVTVYKGIFIPTAITPNGDGKNDVWRIFGLSIFPSYEILVFNRYGQVIYRSKSAMAGWNGYFHGQPVPIGSYPYLIKIDEGKRVLKGLLTVIR